MRSSIAEPSGAHPSVRELLAELWEPSRRREKVAGGVRTHLARCGSCAARGDGLQADAILIETYLAERVSRRLGAGSKHGLVAQRAALARSLRFVVAMALEGSTGRGEVVTLIDPGDLLDHVDSCLLLLGEDLGERLDDVIGSSDRSRLASSIRRVPAVLRSNQVGRANAVFPLAEAAHALDRDNGLSAFWLAVVLSRLELSSRATRIHRSLLGRVEDATLRAASLNELGTIALHGDDPEGAIRYFDQARAPGDLGMECIRLCNLTSASTQRGDRRSALGTLEQALNIGAPLRVLRGCLREPFVRAAMRTSRSTQMLWETRRRGTA